MIKSLVKTRDKLRKNKKGFTLIELLVVIAILAVLAAILIPLVGGFIGQARTGAANADAHTVYTAAATVVAQNPDVTFTGYASAGTHPTMNDTDLTNYLGSHTFAINSITFDPHGSVTAVQITESNGTQGNYPVH